MNAAMSKITKNCADCGVAVPVEIPDDLGIFRRFMVDLPARCSPHQREAEARWEREAAEESAAERARQAQARESACGIPPALRRLVWADLDRSGNRGKIIDDAMRWADGSIDGLLLVGSVGRGKTRIAATAAWAMLGERRVRWISASNMVGALDGRFGSPERTAALHLIREHRALVLDDFDKVRPSEAVAEQMLAAIDERTTWGLPLLVTSNLGAVELAARWPEPFGEAIVSRLVGYCQVWKLSGADRRLS